MKHREEARWAWAAGLFEGEGSLVMDKGRARLQLKMTDEDVVRRFAEVVGGRVYGPYNNDQNDGHIRKDYWLWNSDGSDPCRIARRLEPWLGTRRRARIRALGLLGQQTFPWEDE